MRVLMLTDVYFPRINGVSTSIQTFRRELAELGCGSWLVAPQYPVAWPQDEPAVRRVPARYLAFDPEDRLMRIGRVLEAGRELRGSFDLIHVHTPFVAHLAGRKLGRACGVPVLETYHTHFEAYLEHYFPLLPAHLARSLARSVSRRLCNQVDAVVAPSGQVATLLEQYGVSVPIEIVPTGLDPHELAGGDGERFRRAYQIPAERPVLLHVGRVAFEKNIDFILRATAHVRETIPDVLLVIAGEGPARLALRREVVRLGLAGNVLFVGYLDRRRALLDCYRAADLFVFASGTETQGLVLLEALALGVPVVSTAVLGTKEILEGAKGAVVAAPNERQFAAAAVRLLREPALRACLASEAAAHVADKWSSRAMAERLLLLYERLAGGALRAPPNRPAASPRVLVSPS